MATDKEKIAALKAENAELRARIEKYVCEFRVCRFCMHRHEDCSPTGMTCSPEWCGL